MSENVVYNSKNSQALNLAGDLRTCASDDDYSLVQYWKYRQLPNPYPISSSTARGYTDLSSTRSRNSRNSYDNFRQSTCDDSNFKENFTPFTNLNKNLTSSTFKSSPKGDVAHPFKNFNDLSLNPKQQHALIQSTVSKTPLTETTNQQIRELSRLDTFLNLSTPPNNGTSRQPVPPTVQQMFQNYQYNPKSTINRIKGCITWDGYLPPRMGQVLTEFSKKVFLGGVPWDVSEQQIIQTFNRYGEFKIEWPNNYNSRRNTTKSFLYLIFESLSSINNLLLDCSKEQHGGSVTYNYSFKLDGMKMVPIQVIPWFNNDNIAMYTQESRLNNKLTVFVGALHGRIYAQALGHIFEELFQNVAFVQIDTDRYKYPIGSGRVTFNTIESYRKAIEENFITIIAPKFSKRVQIEPYIEDEPCGKCKIISAPNFCKSRLCFEYFCDNCWAWHHSLESLKNHVPVKRNRKMERY